MRPETCGEGTVIVTLDRGGTEVLEKQIKIVVVSTSLPNELLSPNVVSTLFLNCFSP